MHIRITQCLFLTTASKRQWAPFKFIGATSSGAINAINVLVAPGYEPVLSVKWT